MPTADIDALRELLPWWVRVGAWVALPLCGLAFGVFCVWLADRLNRPKLDGLHWTEQARLHYAGTKVVGAQMRIHVALTAVATYLMAHGLLTTMEPIRRVVLVALGIWACMLVMQFRRARRVLPWLTAADFLRGQLFHWIVFLPVLAVAGVMAIFGPGDLGVSFGLIYGGGTIAMLWFARGGGVTLGRFLGMIEPADDRLKRIVDDAAERTGHRPKNVYLGRTPVANALALPITNELVFTTHAMANLTDREILAITLHEIGHLKEQGKEHRKRLYAMAYFVVIGMWRPIVAWIGIFGFLGLLAVGFAAILPLLRSVRRLETEADSHAHEHQDADEEEAGVYARSLERLHEVNLAPAVVQERAQSHPSLYDRMLACGVTPDYERPPRPPKKVLQIVLFALLALGFYFAEIFAVLYSRDHSYDDPRVAMWGITLSGGNIHPLGALGYHWEKTDPDKAAVVLAFAAAHSRWPEYPARLARTLAPKDPAAARVALDRAEELMADRTDVDPWLRKIVDGARAKLGMPKREW